MNVEQQAWGSWEGPPHAVVKSVKSSHTSFSYACERDTVQGPHRGEP